jgi:hypothetical protein
MAGTGGLISAEISAEEGQNRRAAAALQRLGFRILHVGSTISVSGPEELWHRTFAVSFRVAEHEVLPGRVTRSRQPDREPVIPAELDGLVAAVHFVVPPDLH